jgi:hypothetical protein
MPMGMNLTSVEQRERRHVLRALGGGLVGLLVGPSLDRLLDTSAAEAGGGIVQPIPRRPRPATLSPALFSGKTARAYRIAKEAPELVEQMPCYCGCFKSHSHRNNLDCYVDRHAFG